MRDRGKVKLSSRFKVWVMAKTKVLMRLGTYLSDRTVDLVIQLWKIETHLGYKMQIGNSKDVYFGGR